MGYYLMIRFEGRECFRARCDLAASHSESHSAHAMHKAGGFVAQHQEASDPPTLTDLNAVKPGSRVESARKAVSHLFDRYSGNHPLPPPIARFLDEHWRSYMTQIFVRDGDQSEILRKALEHTKLLMWSLHPKRDDVSRRRLHAVLPELFQWVHTVLRSQNVARSDEDLFFADLAQLQLDALNANAQDIAGSGLGGANQSTADSSPQSQNCNEGEHIGKFPQPADHQRSRLETERPAKAPKPKSDLLQGLAIGTYLEFHSKRATKRVMRLEWISGRAGVYLFREESSGDALCLTADRCLQCLNEGSAVVLI
jgi:hypothetical protein